MKRVLKGRCKAKEITSGRADSVAREQAAEVDHVEAVVEVLSVGLQPERSAFFFVEVGAGGDIDGKCGFDASVSEVDAIDHILAVFRKRLGFCSGKFKRQAASVFCAATREENVPRFFRLPVLASFLREYKRYSPDCSLRIMGVKMLFLRLLVGKQIQIKDAGASLHHEPSQREIHFSSNFLQPFPWELRHPRRLD